MRRWTRIRGLTRFEDQWPGAPAPDGPNRRQDRDGHHDILSKAAIVPKVRSKRLVHSRQPVEADVRLFPDMPGPVWYDVHINGVDYGCRLRCLVMVTCEGPSFVGRVCTYVYAAERGWCKWLADCLLWHRGPGARGSCRLVRASRRVREGEGTPMRGTGIDDP